MTKTKNMLLIYIVTALPFFMAMPFPFEQTAKIFLVLSILGLISWIFYALGFFLFFLWVYNPQFFG
jgi:hypothetical protein